MYEKYVIRRSDRVGASLIGERRGCESSVMKRLERNALKWFGNMEKER